MPVPEQRYPTEQEWDAIHDLKNEFYRRFSELIAELIKKLPTPEVEENLLRLMQDQASVYGSNYEQYLGRKAGIARNIVDGWPK